MEWLLTPLMLSQNYHLVHHLHPSVPFYRYVADLAAQRGGLPRARRRDRHRVRPARSTPTSSASGSSSTASCSKVLPVRMPKRSSAPHAVFHRLPVAAVDPITDDSTLVTLRRARGAARRVPLRARPARHRPHRPRRRGRAAQLLDLRARHPRDAADRGQAHPRRRLLHLRAASSSRPATCSR